MKTMKTVKETPSKEEVDFTLGPSLKKIKTYSVDKSLQKRLSFNMTQAKTKNEDSDHLMSPTKLQIVNSFLDALSISHKSKKMEENHVSVHPKDSDKESKTKLADELLNIDEPNYFLFNESAEKSEEDRNKESFKEDKDENSRNNDKNSLKKKSSSKNRILTWEEEKARRNIRIFINVTQIISLKMKSYGPSLQ